MYLKTLLPVSERLNLKRSRQRRRADRRGNYPRSPPRADRKQAPCWRSWPHYGLSWRLQLLLSAVRRESRHFGRERSAPTSSLMAAGSASHRTAAAPTLRSNFGERAKASREVGLLAAGVFPTPQGAFSGVSVCSRGNRKRWSQLTAGELL